MVFMVKVFISRSDFRYLVNNVDFLDSREQEFVFDEFGDSVVVIGKGLV